MIVRSGAFSGALALALAVAVAVTSAPARANLVAQRTASIASPGRSREQIAREALATITREDQRFGAFIARNEDAVADARKRDAEFGEARSGVLDRRTIAIKANIDLATLPASAGVRQTRRSTTSAVSDAFVVRQILGAGGIIVGATNMDSWARGTRSVSEFGSTGNAFDPNRSPLGSSGGSAVAVATGMVDIALGTDTCGSIRYPASANGIFGLRPTKGAVSRRGVVPLSPTQDVVGPLARNIDDLQLLFDVISQPDTLDPLTLGARQAPARERSRRIGVFGGFGRVDRGADSPVGILRVNGYVVVDIGSTGLVGASVIDDEFERARAFWRRGESPWTLPKNAGYASRLTSQARLQNRILEILDKQNLDAIVYPTTIASPGRRGAKQITGNCWLAANSGLPALAVPGPLANGFPQIGIDLLGRAFDENTLFRVASDAS